MDTVAVSGDGQGLFCRANNVPDLVRLGAGDVVSLVGSRHYYNCAKIVSIKVVENDEAYSQITLQVEPQFNAT